MNDRLLYGKIVPKLGTMKYYTCKHKHLNMFTLICNVLSYFLHVNKGVENCSRENRKIAYNLTNKNAHKKIQFQKKRNYTSNTNTMYNHTTA